MGSAMTAKQKPQAAFITADMPSKVRMAMPFGRDILLYSTFHLEGSNDQESVVNRLQELVGHDGPVCPDTELHTLTVSLEACYALSIAVGLLMRPELFAGAARGGAR
jgi:hypothetical protein